ncbi:autotransporter outer membrane beta-barrel domain-containing protein [Maricaulis salignorans]|uniref:Autotransporter beta-domain-containing protein n=1 Tax=Maricaulis salignorans TaxID=144026 RepID=A0A1G9WRN5_9PROT|nr:autotransporter outer membrane beta-barrel domain-containing protein [Maricaulis salignorans]SDM86786.1 Autotransporter beta-domain-containing protein [Maricaulis salignorans]
MRRRFMFASALVSLTVAAPAAFADREVSTAITDPIATSTAGDGGVADNIVITSSGRVTRTTVGTPALTLDSDNDITQDGVVSVTSDDDGAVGVHIIGGNTGNFTSTGQIVVTSETVPTDEDDDGDVDGPGAIGSNRVAVLVDGVAVFTGDILFSNTSQMIVRGNDSAGIRILTGIDGSVDYSGRLTLVGDRSTAIDIQDNISGDLNVGGSITANGAEAAGVSVLGDVGGGITLRGNISTTGYRFLARPSETFLEQLEPDDLLQGGSALVLSGNVAGGLYVGGPTADTPSEPTSGLATRGDAPTMHIFAGASDIVLGEVVIPAIADDPDTADVDESQAAQHLGYSFVIRGQVTASGDLDGVDATTIRVEGGAGTTATLTGGLLNQGIISSFAYGEPGEEAVATTVSFGAGAIIPLLTNLEELRATAVGTGATARVVMLDAGAYLPSLVNEDTIFANGVEGASAVAIRDLSGSLTSVVNSGVISALYGAPTSADEVAHETVALDLSHATTATLVRQYRRDGVDEDVSLAIYGDVLFGSGDDVLQVESGQVTGNISFGDGADQLVITGGSIVSGVLDDSDGDLAISVDDANLILGATTDTGISDARFGDGAVLSFQIDHTLDVAAFVNASGTVTFETGSRITSALTNLIGEGATYVVLTADSLVIEEALDVLQDTTAPYLYEAALNFDPNDSNSLTLTLQRRTAEQLGMNANQAGAYEATYTVWQNDTELGAAIASLTTERDFFQAYDQLLPEYAASAIQFALATNDSAVGALSNRLDAVRRSPDDTGGLWVQEFGYYADRAGTSFGPGYRGHGIGLAVGFDQPFGPFYAAGVNFVGSASEISEVDGFDDPMSAVSGQIGAYAGSKFGETTLDIYGAVGFDSFEHNRRIVIGSYSASPTASWSGYHLAASARVGRDFSAGNYYLRPSASIDYLGLYEGSYTETGGGSGVDLVVSDRESSSFSATALVTLGARYAGSDSWWSPHIQAGFRNEFSGGETETDAHFVDYDETFTLRSQQIPGTGFIFGFGIAAGSGYSVFSFDYDADLREDFIRHTARLVMRMVF